MPFSRPSEQKCAEHYLLDAVLMFKQHDFNLWYVLKLAARMWEHPHEESVRLQQWRT